MKAQNVKDFYMESFIKLAKMMSKMEANTTCSFLGYQPNLPDSVKKLCRVEKQDEKSNDY